MKTLFSLILIAISVTLSQIDNLSINQTLTPKAEIIDESKLPKETQEEPHSKKEETYKTTKKDTNDKTTKNDMTNSVTKKEVPKAKTPTNKQQPPSETTEKDSITQETQKKVEQSLTLNHEQLNIVRTQFLQYINNERQSSLELSSSLIQSAMLRAQEASQKWSHTRPNGQRWNTTLKSVTDISTVPHGENLAQIQIPYQESFTQDELVQIVLSLHKGLVASPTHYHVMTNENYKKVNIGIYTTLKDQTIIFTIAQHYLA